MGLLERLGQINYYEIMLDIAAIVAVIFVPVIVLRYRQFLKARRLKDLQANLWDDDAMKAYIRLFQSGGKKRGEKETIESSMEKTIREEFFSVHSFRSYALPLFFLSVAAAGAAITIALWTHDALVRAPTNSVTTPVIMSLAGAYVWVVYELLTRVQSQDLAPIDLPEMTLRLLAAIPIGYAFSLIALDSKEGLFAFIAAAFPLRDVRLILRQRAIKKLDMAGPGNESRAREGHLGKIMDGLSDATLARLEELGIVTYMDLAYANPVRLMARTGYSLRHILAWIDQALLAVYAPTFKPRMAELGIPCALDAYEFYEAHCWNAATKSAREWEADLAVRAVATGLKIDSVLLVEILREVYVDPHVKFLNAIWYSETDEVPGRREEIAGTHLRI